MSSNQFRKIAEKPPEERNFEDDLLAFMREKFLKGDIEDVRVMQEKADEYNLDVSIDKVVSEQEIRGRVMAHIYGGTHEQAERIATLAREAGMTNKRAIDIFREHEQIEYDDHIQMQTMKRQQGFGSTNRTKASR